MITSGNSRLRWPRTRCACDSNYVLYFGASASAFALNAACAASSGFRDEHGQITLSLLPVGRAQLHVVTIHQP